MHEEKLYFEGRIKIPFLKPNLRPLHMSSSSYLLQYIRFATPLMNVYNY